MRFWNRPSEADQAARQELLEQLAGLRADIKVLTDQKDRTKDVRALEQRIEMLKLEKNRLDEERARKERDTEHKVGLLMDKQAQDLASAERETKVKIREENLAADKNRFQEQMDFQNAFVQKETERLTALVTALMDKLPTIEAMFSNNGRRHSEED